MSLLLQWLLTFDGLADHLVCLLVGPDEVDILKVEMAEAHTVGAYPTDKVDKLRKQHQAMLEPNGRTQNIHINRIYFVIFRYKEPKIKPIDQLLPLGLVDVGLV